MRKLLPVQIHTITSENANGLVEAHCEVVPHDAVGHALEKRAFTEIEQHDADEPAATDADDNEDRGQKRYGQRESDEARDEQIAVRVDRHRFERVDLVVASHDAELGARRRAGAADHDQRRQHRAELPDETETDGGTKEADGTEPDECIVELQRNDHADEAARNRDDERRARADELHLPEELAPLERSRSESPDDEREIQAHAAEIRYRIDRATPE